MKIGNAIDRLFFAPVSTKGFGLMRIAFGLIALGSFLPQWTSITRFYSDDGILPRTLLDQFLRTEMRFTVFEWIGDPTLVFLVYLFFLACLVFVTLGIFTRPAVFASVLLMFSFHERTPMILAGGDTLIRHIGFVLLLSPCHRSYSLWNLHRRLRIFLKTRKEAPALTMPAWPYRLLLWQVIMMYVGSAWTKFLGSMWWDGSAMGITIHHEHFARFPDWFTDRLALWSPFFSHLTLAIQLLWPLILVLPIVHFFFPVIRRHITTGRIKRLAILGGIVIHGGILILMEVGSFSWVVFAAYIGLLLEEDFKAIRGSITRWIRKPVYVLYDGHCGLCMRTTFGFLTLDGLHVVAPIDFHDQTQRKKIAPDVTLKELDKALHIKLPNGSYRKGFSAFRRLSWYLPWLWPVVPFMYLPGATFIGDRAYESVARRRKRCTHEDCKIG